MRFAMIMAGGSGTRLWPLSRAARPKQLLPIIGGRTLLEIAAQRLHGVVEPAQRLICTGEAFRAPIRATLPMFSDDQILGEPAARDTANAVGLTAAVLAKRDPKAVFAVLTADHLIQPEDRVRSAFELGFTLVESDPRRLVTFAVKPSFAATGYGYVEQGAAVERFPGAHLVKAFVEKPPMARAREYLASGVHWWNSGMFVFSAATFMQALEWYLPETRAGLNRIAEAWDTSKRAAVLSEVYPTLKKISVDFAVMEPASRDARLSVCMVPMNVQWMDVGSFITLGETLTPDGNGNRSNAAPPHDAQPVHLGSTNVLALSDDPTHTITTIDCSNLIIVHTKDATLVCPASSAERVKEMAGKVSDSLR